MSVWPFLVIIVLAPLPVGGLLQAATGTISPILVLAALGWLGITGAVLRIVDDRRSRRGRHVRDQ
jgi:hypothetical protein